MKKILLLLLVIITCINVSYAAFPVTEFLDKEMIEIPPVRFNEPIDNWTLILTLIWPVLFYIFHIPIYEMKICVESIWFISVKTCFSPIFMLSLISFLGSIILSRIALKRKKSDGGINVGNFTHWKAVLALLMLPLVIILEILLSQS